MTRYHRLVLTVHQAWLTLVATVACEVVATMSIKASDGLTKLAPSMIALIGFTLTTLLLAKVVEVIPTSIAYTVWTGSGSVVVALLGVALFGDRLSLVSCLGIALVVLGVVVLNFSERPQRG